MEALVLILAIAIIVGFIIFKSTSEEALEVLDKAKNQKPAVDTQVPVKAAKATKVTKSVKKPQTEKPVKTAVTKKVAEPKATPTKLVATKTTSTRKKKV